MYPWGKKSKYTCTHISAQLPTCDALSHWLFILHHECHINTTTDKFECINPSLSSLRVLCFVAWWKASVSLCVCVRMCWGVTHQSGIPLGHRTVRVLLQKSNQRSEKQQGSQRRIYLLGCGAWEGTKWWKTPKSKKKCSSKYTSPVIIDSPPCQWKLVWCSHSHWTL